MEHLAPSQQGQCVRVACHSLWETNEELALSEPFSVAAETNSNISESMEQCELLLTLQIFIFSKF